MIRKILRSVAVVAVLALAAVGLSATPASAAWTWCTGSAKVCFAVDASGSGTHWESQLLPVGTCIGVPSSMNDKITSLWNKYTTAAPGGQVTIYRHNPCTSNALNEYFTYGPNTVVNNVGAIFNDVISGVCLGPRGAGKCP